MAIKYVPLTITYQASGLVQDKQAFVLADDAYQTLTNCFLFRGRLRRRQGYTLLGRLRRDITGQSLTNMGASATYTYADILTSFRASQATASMVQGTVKLHFTNGSPVTLLDNGLGGFTVTAGTATISAASTINYQTGAISIVFTANQPTNGSAVTVDYSYNPNLPVMGIGLYNLQALNSSITVAFDTIYGYQFNGSTNKWQEIPATTATTWQGTNSDFFQTLTYWYTTDSKPYLWVNNFNQNGASSDPIRVYDGTDWTTIAPTTTGSTKLQNCLLLFSYRGRLVALNTWEGTTLAGASQFPQRARWSQNGAPLSAVASGSHPTATVEWLSDVKGRGGYIDASTNEHIVSAQFIRDLLVVGFEHSTWCLRYTGNEILPFVWERINKELGCQSVNSMVPFDRGILYLGDKSINSCTGTNVDRIDEVIPNQIFEIANSDDPSSELNVGPKRVGGIRDFFERLVYWTYPDGTREDGVKPIYPNRVLVFNYQNNSWAKFTDSFTCFGQFQRFNDLRWQDISDPWSAMNEPWVTSKFQSQFPDIVAGNQQGFVLVMNKNVRNSESLYISAVTGGASKVVTTSPSHNLEPEEFVLITGIIGTGASDLNGRIFQVDIVDKDNVTLRCFPRFAITGISNATSAVVTCPGHNFEVDDHWYIDNVSGMTQINGFNGLITAVTPTTVTIDHDTSSYDAYTSGGAIQDLDSSLQDVFVSAGTYYGGGLMAKVMNFTSASKKFNLLGDGKKAVLGHIDFLADKTQGGEISVQIFADYNDENPVNSYGDSMFNQVISTDREQFSQTNISKEWHRFYCQQNCQFFQYNLKFNDRQMSTPNINYADVYIDAVVIYSGNGGRLVN